MNKLEHYLQQVCRSMGGPKALREHVRQELREHLLDAVAQHQTAGLSEEQAIDRALAEFGTPETVRGELEATHGHRMALALVIDKAMEWKEKTMKAKWLWTTWTYLMVVGIIALEILFLCFQFVTIIPKIKKLKSDGFVTVNDHTDSVIIGIHDLLAKLCVAAEWVTWWLILIVAVIWGLFEWRVKSENKTFIRLSVLTSVAMGLLVVVILMAGSLMVLPILAMPGLGSMTPNSMINQLENMDASLTEAQQAAKKNDELAVVWQLNRVSHSLSTLSNRSAFSTWLQIGDQQTVDALTKSITKTKAQIDAANDVVSSGNSKELVKAVEAVQQAFEPLRTAVKRVREKEKKSDR